MAELLTMCPLCSTPSWEEVYTTGDRHYRIPGEFRVVRCVNCSLIFLNPMYSDEELAGMYPADYYAYQDKFQSDGFKQGLKRALGFRTTTKDPRFAAPGRVLDIGCGSGWFLRNVQDQGWTAYGVEINAAAAQIGRELGGLNIFCGTLEQAGFPPDYFDYVRSNHAFEHMSRPKEQLQEMRRILKPGGKLMLGVPNIESLAAKLFGRYWWYLGAPVHPFSYSVRTLTALLQENGFAIENVVYNGDYYGILGSCQIWLNRKNGKKSSEGSVVNNPLLRLGSQWLMNMMDWVGQGDCIEVTSSRVC